MKIISDKLTLRLPSDSEIIALAEEASSLSDDEQTDPASSLLWHWQARANLSPQSWNLIMAIIPHNHPKAIGYIELRSENFLNDKIVVTGIWLSPRHRGYGWGHQAHRAALYFAFNYLGAKSAAALTATDNQAAAKMLVGLNYQKCNPRLSADQEWVLFPQNLKVESEVAVLSIQPYLSMIGINRELIAAA